MAGAACAFARPAAAQIYEVTASGVITQVYDSKSQLDSSAVVGTPYTFSFLFDYSIPGQYLSPSDVSYQPGSSANLGATAAFGDYTFAPTNVSVSEFRVNSNSGGIYANNFSLVSYQESTTGFSLPKTASYVGILGSSSTSFATAYAQFPLSAYNTANFDSSLIFEAFISADTIAVGSVTSLSAQLVAPAAVPEASTTVSLGVLLGLGGLMLVVRRRRTAAGK